MRKGVLREEGDPRMLGMYVEPVIAAREAGSRFVSEYMLSRDVLGGRHSMARRCGLLFLPAKLHPIDKTAETAGFAPEDAV